ncbi:MAG: Asp-tRNA(Asn)/Glu-tRNA(Gln) amidotransferase subunit GatB [Chloroflexota bacterium]
MTWEPVIGLEIHAQLLTKSKMFCGCSAAYADTAANSHVCPVCAGMPGVLPVANREAIRQTIMTALALHCAIPEFSKVDRKYYFYPDLPKGYQISQYDLPLSRHGYLDIQTEGTEKRIGITRVHLEEDTGKSTHPGGGYSLVDLNRCGVPLIEIVSEPDMRSAEEARLYFMKLRGVLLYLGVSNGDMSRGCLRCDANVSVRPAGSTGFGTKTEVKNMNSFRAVKQAIDFEIARQIRVLESKGRVVQETRGWVEETRETVSQRVKEQADDYRYFPEPDLPPLVISRAWIQEIEAGLPELADARAARLERDYALSPLEAAQLTASRAMADLFEQTAALLTANKRAAANWLLGEFQRLLNESGIEADQQRNVRPACLAMLIGMVESGALSSSAAKTVFEQCFRTGEAPDELARKLGLRQVSDRSSIEPLALKAMAENAGAVADYRRGKTQALGRVVGAVMKEMKSANPALVGDLLRELIEREDAE